MVRENSRILNIKTNNNMDDNLILFEDTTSMEINARLMNRDYDDVDNEINNQLIAQAIQGDDDEEMAQLFGY